MITNNSRHTCAWDPGMPERAQDFLLSALTVPIRESPQCWAS